MPVEIGNLVVKGSFCNMDEEDAKMKELHEDVQDMRARILADVAEMFAAAERRRIGR